MRTRIRFGPFTFGSSGVRLSSWRGGTGFSIPLFNSKASSFGKVKLGFFSFYFNGKPKRQRLKKSMPDNIKRIKESHTQAYEPWTTKSDNKLQFLVREGKSVKEMSVLFGRTNGAIRSRMKKLSLL